MRMLLTSGERLRLERDRVRLKRVMAVLDGGDRGTGTGAPPPEGWLDQPEAALAVYRGWIADLVAALGGGALLAGWCAEVSERMQAAFPALELVAGWVTCEHHPRWPHWYLRTPEGVIVDPTAAQFAWLDRYGEFAPGDLVLTGSCPVCHAHVYAYADCCVRFLEGRIDVRLVDGTWVRAQVHRDGFRPVLPGYWLAWDEGHGIRIAP